MSKTPQWFTDWLTNDYIHLAKCVSDTKRDVGWIKWLLAFIFAAITGTAIAIITG